MNNHLVSAFIILAIDFTIILVVATAVSITPEFIHNQRATAPNGTTSKPAELWPVTTGGASPTVKQVAKSTAQQDSITAPYVFATMFPRGEDCGCQRSAMSL